LSVYGLQMYFDKCIASLSKRMKISNMQIVFKLVNVFIDCPELLCYLNFIVPQCRTRGLQVCFMYSHVEKNYALASSINWIMTSIANEKNIELLNVNFIGFFNSLLCKQNFLYIITYTIV